MIFKRNLFSQLGSFSLLLIALVTFVSCSETKLNLAVKAANKDCPIDLEGVGTVTSITYEDNSIFYNCRITDPDLDAESIRAAAEYLKPLIISDLVNDPDSDIQDLIKLVLDAKANMVYRFTDRLGDKAEVLIAPHELKQATSQSVSDAAISNIDSMVALSNKNLAGEGITCHKEGKSMVFVYSPDAFDYTLDEIREEKRDFKDILMQSIAPDEDPVYEFCAENGLDLVYRFTDYSGNSVDIRIASDEISDRL